MVFSVMYPVVRNLLGLIMQLARGDTGREVKLLVLRHENAILRRQVRRSHYQPADRMWLAALSRRLSRRRQAEIFPVTPATLMRWHRRLVAPDGTTHTAASRDARRPRPASAG
jgi:putative transposase